MGRLSTLSARLLAAAACALGALSLGASAATAATTVPDPLAYGPHPTKKIDYEAGTLLLTLPDGVSTTPVPLRGSITYADDVDFADVVVFVHGRHASCLGSPTAPRQICDDVTDPDGTPTQSDVRSYGGYDYMAKNLASHGYTVMSVEANTTNFDNGWRDGGANARSQIIQANLELLWRWNNAAGPYVPGEPDHTVGTKLVGRLNFAEGIGLMGHSRGGDAVTDFIAYTRNLRPRSGFQRFTLAGVLALAPVYYSANKVPYGTNYGMLLPACDGDVSTLQGGRFFENAKYAPGGDTFAKVQWYVQGANHNFFNTVWTQDDFSFAGDPACSRGLSTSARLAPADQRRVGAALMNAFMRRYVGRERAFDPIMTGAVTLPESAAPRESGKGLAEEVKTSYVAPSAARLDVLRPTPAADPQPAAGPEPRDPTLWTTTAAGGPLTTSGLLTFDVCNPTGPAYRRLTGDATAPPSYPSDYALCPENANNRSIGTQYTLSWNGPAAITAALGSDGATKDVSTFGVLDLRASVNRDDPLNPLGDGFTPNAVTQDFDVTLVDADGSRATTNAAAWTTALEPSIGVRYTSGGREVPYRHVVLNGIRIPLTAFRGVDLRRVRAVELGFGTRTPSGSIQLADVMFQEAPIAVDPVVPPPDGPPSIPPGPIVDPPRSAPTPGVCRDTKKPVAKLTRVAVKAKKLWIRGVAVDSGCAGGRGVAAGGVARTLVQLYKPVSGGKARFVTARGTLSKPLPLSGGIAIPAAGRGDWSVAIAKAKLPRGSYRLRVTTYDRAGNARRLGVRTVTLR